MKMSKKSNFSRPPQYLGGIPALKFFHFRTPSARCQQFVHCEQLATVQLGEIDNFVDLDPKK